MNNLQNILGDAYHDGITIDEINSALEGKKFADLSTGAYVDRNKYDADLKARDAEIQKKAQELSAKMTADEKAQAAQKEKDALIEDLKKQIQDSNISNSKSTAETVMAKSKTILGIADDDEAYIKFIGSISSENADNTKVLASYINKLVTDSYEKGKKDASKDNLGLFSKGITTGTGEGGEIDNYGKQLADATKSSDVDSNLYFKRK